MNMKRRIAGFVSALSIVVAMADGYHRVCLKPAFVNLHVIAGTAQAAGQQEGDDVEVLVVAGGQPARVAARLRGRIHARRGFRRFHKLLGRQEQGLTAARE